MTMVKHNACRNSRNTAIQQTFDVNYLTDSKIQSSSFVINHFLQLISVFFTVLNKFCQNYILDFLIFG